MRTLEFKEGDRVLVVGNNRSIDKYIMGGDMIGHKGVIHKIFGDSDYGYVRIDDHPGFENQEGCWAIDFKLLKLDGPSNNEEALNRLQTELSLPKGIDIN